MRFSLAKRGKPIDYLNLIHVRVPWGGFISAESVFYLLVQDALDNVVPGLLEKLFLVW
jgi:hypothetical protein